MSSTHDPMWDEAVAAMDEAVRVIRVLRWLLAESEHKRQEQALRYLALDTENFNLYDLLMVAKWLHAEANHVADYAFDDGWHDGYDEGFHDGRAGRDD